MNRDLWWERYCPVSRAEWHHFKWGLIYGAGLAGTVFLAVLITHLVLAVIR